MRFRLIDDEEEEEGKLYMCVSAELGPIASSFVGFFWREKRSHNLTESHQFFFIHLVLTDQDD
jgi:hypothetical protein